MEILRIAICEDDPVEQQRLLQILDESQCPMTISKFSNGEDFLTKFQPFQYDLILMDIFMGGLTGVEVVTEIRKLDTHVPVAFITSSQDFALESYRLNALKYIEKPATAKALAEAIQFAQMKQNMVERLVLRTTSGALSYPTHQIMFIEQKGRNLVLHLSSKEEVCVPKKLDEAENQLLGKDFFRCHKSYLVNLAFVCGLDRDLSIFTMEHGKNVHIRRESFGGAKRAFETYLFAKGQEVPHG